MDIGGSFARKKVRRCILRVEGKEHESHKTPVWRNSLPRHRRGLLLDDWCLSGGEVLLGSPVSIDMDAEELNQLLWTMWNWLYQLEIWRASLALLLMMSRPAAHLPGVHCGWRYERVSPAWGEVTNPPSLQLASCTHFWRCLRVVPSDVRSRVAATLRAWRIHCRFPGWSFIQPHSTLPSIKN